MVQDLKRNFKGSEELLAKEEFRKFYENAVTYASYKGGLP